MLEEVLDDLVGVGALHVRDAFDEDDGDVLVSGAYFVVLHAHLDRDQDADLFFGDEVEVLRDSDIRRGRA